MDLELTHKRAIITGGSKGIGFAIARELAREGVDLVLAARDSAGLERAAKEIGTFSDVKVLCVPTDTSDDQSVKSLIATTVGEFGGVDILVNSAASTGIEPRTQNGIGIKWPTLAETTDDAFWADVNVKVVGYLRTARAVAPHMAAQGWGRIINISGLGARKSNSIVRSIRNVSVAALTKNLADELGKFGINVTVVHPGPTRTETMSESVRQESLRSGISVTEIERQMAGNAIDRLVDASEIGYVVAFLASAKSASISGDAVAVGGGTLGAIYY